MQIAFDDHRLVADAGLILPTTLARHLGLSETGTGVPKTLGERRSRTGRTPATRSWP